jgi:hypothetical protein
MLIDNRTSDVNGLRSRFASLRRRLSLSVFANRLKLSSSIG